MSRNKPRVRKQLVKRAVATKRDFWKSPTLDELAKSQNVRPLADAKALFGTWPGEVDDGFEAAVDELRQACTRGICPA